MFRKFSTLLLISTVVSFIFISSIQATNGYFRHGYGIKYSALAGSGVAVSLSSLGAVSNPAGIVFQGCSRYDINISVFSPSRDYTVTGNPSGAPNTFGLTPGKIESDSKYFFFPTLGGSWKISSNMAVGLALYGNGGMNTNYPTATFYDPSSPGTGVNLEQMFAAATYSFEFAENHAVGLSAIFGWQRFAAKGLASFSNFSSDPNSLTGNAFSTSTGFGGKIGYQGQFGEMIRVGASYQSKIFMSEFDRYKGLFAEAGDFDVPSNWSVGVAVMPAQNWTFLLDFQQILYSGIKAINNPLIPNIQTSQLGKDDGAGFGWKDMNVIKFGVMTNLNEGWTLMGGYSYGTQVVPESEVLFNILAPGVVQHHITLGVTKELNEQNELNLAFMYAPAVTVSGTNPLEAPNTQTIAIQMSQFQVEVGYAFSSL